MIRTTNNKIIIEIPYLETEDPAEKIGNMQTGLINLIALIDYDQAPKSQIGESLCCLTTLLKEMIIAPA